MNEASGKYIFYITNLHVMFLGQLITHIQTLVYTLTFTPLERHSSSNKINHCVELLLPFGQVACAFAHYIQST